MAASEEEVQVRFVEGQVRLLALGRFFSGAWYLKGVNRRRFQTFSRDN